MDRCNMNRCNINRPLDSNTCHCHFDLSLSFGLFYCALWSLMIITKSEVTAKCVF